MAKYTIELRKIIDTLGEDEVKSFFTDYELSDYLTEDEIAVIETRGTWNKEKLAQKIIDHYYMREIGSETVALFKHYCKRAMRELMEEKLPLIYSAAIKYDPLVNVDYTETYNSTNTSTGNSSGVQIDSDTPQGRVTKENILAGNYATATSGSESTGTTNGTENYIKNIKGNSGVSATAQKMVQLYRENIIAIDREIIEELSDLFMVIW